MLTVEQFDNYLNKLALHDWFYDYSDDNRVWRAGKDARQSLMEQAAKETILAQAFTAWGNCVFTKDDRIKALHTRDRVLSQLRREITEPKE